MVTNLSYLRAGRPGDDHVVAIEKQWRHGWLVAAGALGGGKHLEHARISHALVYVHVVDERLTPCCEHGLILPKKTKVNSEKLLQSSAAENQEAYPNHVVLPVQWRQFENPAPVQRVFVFWYRNLKKE